MCWNFFNFFSIFHAWIEEKWGMTFFLNLTKKLRTSPHSSHQKKLRILTSNLAKKVRWGLRWGPHLNSVNSLVCLLQCDGVTNTCLSVILHVVHKLNLLIKIRQGWEILRNVHWREKRSWNFNLSSIFMKNTATTQNFTTANQA